MIVSSEALTVNLTDDPVQRVSISEAESCPNPECENHHQMLLAVSFVQETGEVTGVILTQDDFLKLIASGHSWAAANIPGKLLSALDSAATT